MNEVIRQRYTLMSNLLNNERYGTMNDASIDFLLRRCLDNLSATEKLLFQNEALYLIPTCKMTRNVTLAYLEIFIGPYAVTKPVHDSYLRLNKNHCISELSYPVLSAMFVGSVFMLLKNFIVKITNEWMH